VRAELYAHASMDPDPGESGQPQNGDERVARSRTERARQERYGPLALERHAKDDGRTLLLYMRADADRS
jgi:hypothetical protein